MHERNEFSTGYDLERLTAERPDLAPWLRTNPAGRQTIDFTEETAVKTLNQALLQVHFGVKNWDIPAGYLCPPVPGRLDYVHYVADLLAGKTGVLPRGKKVRGLDVGCGANCIYPILAHRTYGWRMIGTDTDTTAVRAAAAIVAANPVLRGKIEVRAQGDEQSFFGGVTSAREHYAFSMCNPPSHPSAEAAAAATERKWKNLGLESKDGSNFGGLAHELWRPGGEVAFIRAMMTESKEYGDRIDWFTTLVSRREHLPVLRDHLKTLQPLRSRTMPMGQGNKVSRIMAWSFAPEPERVRQGMIE